VTSPVELGVLDTAAAVACMADWLFGLLPEPTGVAHPTACVLSSDGAYRTLRIEPRTPKSLHDLFALHLQRARADVIVTTGAILRAEPEARYGLETSPWAKGLSAYRARLGKGTPLVAVLSRKELDAKHPAIHEPRIQVWGPRATPGVAHRPFDGRPSDAVQALRVEGLVVVEAGPTVTEGLHAADAVDALFLTTFEGEVDDVLLAGSAFDIEGLSTRLAPVAPPRRVAEPSGSWKFCAYRRR